MKAHRIRHGESWYRGVVPTEDAYVLGSWGARATMVILCLDPARS